MRKQTLNSISTRQLEAVIGNLDHTHPHCEGTPRVSCNNGESIVCRVQGITHSYVFVCILAKINVTKETSWEYETYHVGICAKGEPSIVLRVKRSVGVTQAKPYRFCKSDKLNDKKPETNRLDVPD